MSAGGSTHDSLSESVRTWILPLTVVLVGVTATTIVDEIGLSALAVIWLLVVTAIVALLVTRKRRTGKEAPPGIENTTLMEGSTESRPNIIDVTLTVPPFDDYEKMSKRIKKSTICIKADSVYGSSFNFLVLTEDEFERYQDGRRCEPLIAVSNVTSFKDSLRIPRADNWHFVVEATGNAGNSGVKLIVRDVS